MVAARDQDHLPRLAGASEELLRPFAFDSLVSAGMNQDQRPARRAARPPRAGRARRATPRGRLGLAHRRRPRASRREGRAAGGPRPPGRSAITPATASLVAAAWMAMNPPRLEPAGADARRVDAVVARERAGDPRDVVDHPRGHLVARLAVAALVVGDRRPAGRRAGAAEVGVVFLPRAGAVADDIPGHGGGVSGSQSQYGRPATSPRVGRLGVGSQRRRMSLASQRRQSPPHASRGENRRGLDRGRRRLSDRHQGQRARPAGDRRLRRDRAGARVRHPGIRLRGRRLARACARVSARILQRGPTTSRCSTRRKAAPITAIHRVFIDEGLSVDVASGGELHVALAAGFDPGRIYVHGNNKTDAELRRATEDRVGHVICDSFDEIERLDRICCRQRTRAAGDDPRHAGDQGRDPLLRPDRPARLEVRVRARGRACRRARSPRCSVARHLRLDGLHAHIGSQIFELEPYARAIEALASLADPAWCRMRERRRRARDRVHERGRPALIDSYVEVKVEGVQRLFDPAPADPRRAGPVAGRQRRGHRL